MNSLERLRIRLNGEEVDDDVLLDLLESAKNIILTYRYPCGNFPTVKTESGVETFLEPRYNDLQVRVAIELYSKMGAEGQTSHAENTIARSYESAGISPSLLAEITPKVEVIS